MIKHAALLLSLASQFAYAELIEKDDAEYWTVDGLAHYVRSQEDERFVANLVSRSGDRSVIAFTNTRRSCYEGGEKKNVKIHYQWVKYIRTCASGNEYWIPVSQQGKSFVKQHFSSNADVKVLFNNIEYTFSTKEFVSVRQRWEITVRALGDAI
ncbi:hypothetical protein [Vibrio sinaloensis]|uniref:hypothetical protein n=1 Tax=Photobacterium sp. (strain ATCC 43367) TaxID=379097 RepID=UPI0035E5A4E7